MDSDTDDVTNVQKQTGGRIAALDRARGIAILGMILENYVTVIYGWSHDGVDRAAGFLNDSLHFTSRLLEGRSAPLFVVLAGMGVSLMTSRARESDGDASPSRMRNMVFKRALFLFSVGMAFMLLWPPDILHYFGCYFAIGALLISASDGKLLGGVAFFVLGFVALFLVFDYYQGWDWETLTYPALWTGALPMIKNLFFNGYHPIFPWTAFFLFGMWLGRRRISDPPFARKLAVVGLIVLGVAEMLSCLSIRHAAPDSLVAMLFSTEFFPPLAGYLFSTGASASLILGLFLLADGGEHSRRPGPLAATGQLSLTIFLAHVVVGMGVLEMMGRLEYQTIEFAYVSAAICCAASLVFAFVWRRVFSRGPFEALMRKVAG